MALKAIETQYKGYRFRSRLEARWAVFYDMMGIPFLYEPEGFDLDGIWYLPDFWLPKQNCWVEIKGQDPTEEERHKASLLAEHAGNAVYIFYGDCWYDSIGIKNGAVHPYQYSCYYWYACPSCHKPGIAIDTDYVCGISRISNHLQLGSCPTCHNPNTYICCNKCERVISWNDRVCSHCNNEIVTVGGFAVYDVEIDSNNTIVCKEKDCDLCYAFYNCTPNERLPIYHSSRFSTKRMYGLARAFEAARSERFDT